MTCAIKNTTGKDMSTVGKMISEYFPYAEKEMGFDQPVTVILKSDLENAKNPLGKTAYYDPTSFEIVLYIDGRHPKDIARSFSHELVHHKQNCNGELEGVTGEQGYAQTETGHKVEEEAYSLGNTCFRNWEDQLKKRMNETSYYKRGDIAMNEQILREAIKKAFLKSPTLRRKYKLAEKIKKSLEDSLDLEEAEKKKKDNKKKKTEVGTVEVETEVETDVEIKEENLDEEEDVVEEGSINELHPDNPFARPDAPALVNCDKVRAMKKKLEGEIYEMERDPSAGATKHSQMSFAPPEDTSKLRKQLEYLTTAEHWQSCWQGMEKPFKGDMSELEESIQEIKEEKPLKEWYGNSLYNKLLKEYTKR